MIHPPPASRIKRFVINVISSIGTRVLGITVLVWVNQYLLRRIEPEEYSLFPVVMSLVLFSSLFVTIFLGGVSRFVVEAHARGDDAAVTRIVSSMLVVLVPVALLLVVVGALASWRIDLVMDVAPDYLGEARIMLVLAVLSLCLTTAAAPLAQGLYVRERFVTDNLIQLFCEGLRIVLLLTLMFAAGTRVMWLVVASTAATLANQVFLIVLTRKLLPAARFERRSVCWTTMKSVLAFGTWTSVQGIAQLVSRTAPVLLLNRFAPPLQVALFHVGRLPEQQIRGMLQAFEGPALPALIALYAREGTGAINTLYYRGGRYYLWSILLPAAPALVFAEPLFRLYAGDRYAGAGLVMSAFLVGLPFLYASGMYYIVAHSIGKIGAFLSYQILVQVATIIALYYAVAIRGLGAMGAALAIAITQTISQLFPIWRQGLRLVNGRWKDFARQTLAPGLFPFGAALVVSLLMARSFTVDSWWKLGLASVGAVLVYASVLFAFCVDELDRSLLERGLRLLGSSNPKLRRARTDVE